MYEKDYSRVPFVHYGSARTLEPKTGLVGGGWFITATIYEDYFSWVNEFEATHPLLGRVWGNFEETVWATSQEAHDDFIKHNPFSEWDYRDI